MVPVAVMVESSLILEGRGISVPHIYVSVLRDIVEQDRGYSFGVKIVNESHEGS